MERRTDSLSVPKDLLSLNAFGIINPFPLKMHSDLKVSDKRMDLLKRISTLEGVLEKTENMLSDLRNELKFL